MNSPETLKKAVDLLVKGTPEILSIEAMAEPSESDTTRLRAWGRIAHAVAVHKGIATAGSDKPSEIIRKLTFPIAITPLKNGNAEAAQARRESDEKSLKALKAIAKGNAFDPAIYDQLATILLSICRARGIAVSASASPAELLDRVRPLLLIEGMRPKA